MPSLCLSSNRLEIKSLFESLVPCFDTESQPDEDVVLKMKMIEVIRAILKTDWSWLKIIFYPLMLFGAIVILFISRKLRNFAAWK